MSLRRSASRLEEVRASNEINARSDKFAVRSTIETARLFTVVGMLAADEPPSRKCRGRPPAGWRTGQGTATSVDVFPHLFWRYLLAEGHSVPYLFRHGLHARIRAGELVTSEREMNDSYGRTEHKGTLG